MNGREPVVVFGVLLGLVLATIVPYAVPAVQRVESAPDGRLTPATDTPDSPTTVRRPGTLDPPSPNDHQRRPVSPTAARPSTPPAPVQSTLAGSTYRCDSQPTLPTADRLLRRTSLPVLTADSVDVAVIDPSGYDLDDPRIADNVVATRSFSSTGSLTIRNQGSSRHGTQSAAILTHVAPDANLYLANFVKARDFRRAIEWATRRDVDVIVAPVTFFAKPNDGSAPVSKAVTKATERGIPVVVPVGNVANQHWEGTYLGGGTLEFAPNDTRMYLRGSDRPVQIWLWWNQKDPDDQHQFEVVLYKDLGDHSERIGTSTDYPRGDVGTNQVLYERIQTNRLLSQSIGEGSFYIKVEGPPDAVHEVELVSVNHRLENPMARGSLLAPATARGDVIAVGAVQRVSSKPMPISSWGPTNDGRTGIDVLGPGTAIVSEGARFRGTSVATAYTGGVVALLKAADPTLTPAQVEAILQATADHAPPNEVNILKGHGVLDPDGALNCVGGGEPATNLSVFGD